MKIKTPSIVLNDDACNFLAMHDNQRAANLEAYLARYAVTQVDIVAYCVTFGGGICLYNTEVGERIGAGFAVTENIVAHRLGRNVRSLAAEVGDYIGFTFSTLKRLGLRAIASFRMNDAHMSANPTGHVAGRFWMDHPEFRLGESRGYYSSCMDYSVPAVREFVRALINEVIEKFPDIDGIELDFMRSPFVFKEGGGCRNAHIITGMIAGIRRDLDRAAERNSCDRYLVTTNIPRSPALALECGFDVREWCERDLVDMVAAGCYATDMQIPFEDWKKALPQTPVFAYLNCGSQPGTYHSLEQYRAAAANGYAGGADGIYLFNYPCFDELSGLIPKPVDGELFPLPSFNNIAWHPDLDRARKAICELGDPTGLRGKDKHYLFYAQEQGAWHYPPGPVPIDRIETKPARLIFRCWDNVSEAAAVELAVKLVSVTVNDHFHFALNGDAVPPECITRLHAVRGRDARIHSVRLGPYSQYRLQVRPGMLREGENLLEIELKNKETGLTGKIKVCELELMVKY